MHKLPTANINIIKHWQVLTYTNLRFIVNKLAYYN